MNMNLDLDLKQLNEQIEQIIEMSPRLTKEDTNVPVLLWASKKMGKHNSRIKILNRRKYRDEWNPQESNDVLSISIGSNPQVVSPENYKINLKNKDYQKVRQWIIQNQQPLLDFWNETIEWEECKKRLTKLD